MSTTEKDLSGKIQAASTTPELYALAESVVALLDEAKTNRAVAGAYFRLVTMMFFRYNELLGISTQTTTDHFANPTPHALTQMDLGKKILFATGQLVTRRDQPEWNKHLAALRGAETEDFGW